MWIFVRIVFSLRIYSDIRSYQKFIFVPGVDFPLRFNIEEEVRWGEWPLEEAEVKAKECPICFDPLVSKPLNCKQCNQALHKRCWNDSVQEVAPRCFSWYYFLKMSRLLRGGCDRCPPQTAPQHAAAVRGGGQQTVFCPPCKTGRGHWIVNAI